MKMCPFHHLTDSAMLLADDYVGVSYDGINDPNVFCNLATHAVNET